MNQTLESQTDYKDGLGNPLRDGFYVQREEEGEPIVGRFPHYNQIVFINTKSKTVKYSNGTKKRLVLWSDSTPRPDEFEPITAERIQEVIAFRKEDLKNLEKFVEKHSSL